MPNLRLLAEILTHKLRIVEPYIRNIADKQRDASSS